mgnify:CR=1 FL=1
MVWIELDGRVAVGNRTVDVPALARTHRPRLWQASVSVLWDCEERLPSSLFDTMVAMIFAVQALLLLSASAAVVRSTRPAAMLQRNSILILPSHLLRYRA